MNRKFKLSFLLIVLLFFIFPIVQAYDDGDCDIGEDCCDPGCGCPSDQVCKAGCVCGSVECTSASDCGDPFCKVGAYACYMAYPMCKKSSCGWKETGTSCTCPTTTTTTAPTTTSTIDDTTTTTDDTTTTTDVTTTVPSPPTTVPSPTTIPVDSTPPAVNVEHSPTNVGQGDTVTINASASDASGIKETRIYADTGGDYKGGDDETGFNLIETNSSSVCKAVIG
ncbi:MAG: hypothetical protein ABEK36_01730, partial [Candidatus Aenigmatarchaeota archaeon]